MKLISPVFFEYHKEAPSGEHYDGVYNHMFNFYYTDGYTAAELLQRCGRRQEVKCRTAQLILFSKDYNFTGTFKQVAELLSQMVKNDLEKYSTALEHGTRISDIISIKTARTALKFNIQTDIQISSIKMDQQDVTNTLIGKPKVGRPTKVLYKSINYHQEPITSRQALYLAISSFDKEIKRFEKKHKRFNGDM